MVQSVELLPDAAAEAWVRAQWDALAAAGLPSLAHHRGETNRPHVTLGVARAVGDDDEAALAEAIAEGGWREAVVRLGGFVVFGPHGRSGRFVLARLAVPTARLLALQARVDEAWRDAVDVPDNARPGAWTPHVTLALRLTAEQVVEALGLAGALGPAPTPTAPRGVRRWDGTERREWWLTGSDGGGATRAGGPRRHPQGDPADH